MRLQGAFSTELVKVSGQTEYEANSRDEKHRD